MARKLPGSTEGSKIVSALDLLHLARTAAEAGAGYLRGVERPADPSGWRPKGARDFVTEVDRTAERIWRTSCWPPSRAAGSWARS